MKLKEITKKVIVNKLKVEYPVFNKERQEYVSETEEFILFGKFGFDRLLKEITQKLDGEIFIITEHVEEDVILKMSFEDFYSNAEKIVNGGNKDE